MAERYEYTKGRLLESEANPNPSEQFAHWLQEAIAAKVVEPTAMCVSTVGPYRQPSSRMVLLRGHDERGFTFFTNYESRKGRHIAQHPYACLNFWWGELERQVRIEGRIEMTSNEESNAYWDSRPHDSQLASAASPQSNQIFSREELAERVLAVKHDHPQVVPRPSHWGGYRLKPSYFEFWQGGPARLHDRLVYRLVDGGWQLNRLAP